MAELKNNLDDIDTHYKVIASTDGKFEIYEKFPGASEEKPLTTSFILIPDEETADAIQKIIDTGEQITITNQFIKDVQLPELYTKLFKLNTEEVTIVLGPAKSDNVLKVRAIVQAQNEDSVAIENIELKKVSGGEKQSVLSNEHQDLANSFMFAAY